MSDERRDNPRMPIALDVTLHYSSLRLLDCQTRDLSLEGAYVHTGGQALPERASVDMALVLSVGDEVRYHNLCAEVARVDRDGVGVMFVQCNYASRKMLASLLDTGWE